MGLSFMEFNWKGGNFLTGREGQPRMPDHSTPANGATQAPFHRTI